MADTGAPWNLPYPLSSDLVKDGATNIKDLAEAAAAALTNSSRIKQVKQVITTADFSTTSTTLVDVTGVTISITPSNASNRILMLFTANIRSAGNSRQSFFRFRRDTTDLFEEVEQQIETLNRGYSFAMSFDESASSTSARTYTVRTRVGSSTGTIDNSAFYVIEYAP